MLEISPCHTYDVLTPPATASVPCMALPCFGLREWCMQAIPCVFGAAVFSLVDRGRQPRPLRHGCQPSHTSQALTIPQYVHAPPQHITATSLVPHLSAYLSKHVRRTRPSHSSFCPRGAGSRLWILLAVMLFAAVTTLWIDMSGQCKPVYCTNGQILHPISECPILPQSIPACLCVLVCACGVSMHCGSKPGLVAG